MKHSENVSNLGVINSKEILCSNNVRVYMSLYELFSRKWPETLSALLLPGLVSNS